MKIEINDAMKLLLSNYKFHFNNEYDLKPLSEFGDIISNRVLKASFEDSDFWYDINETNLDGNINNIWYNFEFTNNTSRIDDVYFRTDISQEFSLFYAFITIGGWFSTLKKIYPKDKFIFLIQYDEWDDDVSPWFFVKWYHFRDFQRLFWSESILGLELPYISVWI